MMCEKYYTQLSGQSPAAHQKACWELLSQGKPVIVRAPTGSGKTEAVALPFLHFRKGVLPHRMIYALPLRSLANRLSERIESYAARSQQGSLRVRLQHGESPESVLFTADIVVATIDQVVTSYACSPLTLPVRHGNIPAGAVMSSFLVFDEVHLFDPELGLQATRLICERLNRLGLLYAVLSATLPDSVLEFWHDQLGAEVVEAYSEFVQREVPIEWKASLLTPDEVIKALGEAGRILVVCNTVDKAIEVYQQVSSAAKQQGYECNVLHSRFLPEGRRRKEDWIEQHFGKNSSENTKALLIATQVVEVGLDISADLLLTEVATIDALIQRAGRVARWGGNGKVWVYDVEHAAPYRQELVNQSKELLQKESGAALDWTRVKCWVNQVLNDSYRTILRESNAYKQVVAQLSRAAFEGSRSQAEAAIRDINTVEVTLHSNPSRLGRDVLRLPTLSVHIGTAKKWAQEAHQAKSQVWRIEIDRSPSDAHVTVKMEAIQKADDIFIGDRLVFPPSLLAYSDDLGLRWDRGGQDFPVGGDSEREELHGTLSRESWIEHNVRVAQTIDQVLKDEYHAVSALARLLGVSEDTVKQAVKLAALLHDLGKLNQEWQEKAGVTPSAGPEDLLAHSDGRDYVQFPPHATVSAYALWPALVDGGTLPRLLAKAVCFAIAHHHSVRAKEVPSYEFHRRWEEAVSEALRQYGLSGSVNVGCILSCQPSPTNLREKFPPLENEKLYTAYVLLSRWLRLADRIATGGPDAVLHYENWFGCF